MADRICSIAGCGRKLNGRLYCSGHEQRRRKHGDPMAQVPLRRRRETCTVSGCNEKHHANGLCSRHSMQLRKTGEIRGSFRERTECSVEGCKRGTYAEMCWRHARRTDPTAPAKIQGAPVLNDAGRRLCTDCREWCNPDDFPQMYGHVHTCGSCLRAKRSDYALARWVKLHENAVEKVDRREVFERDGWVCGICSEPIDSTLKFPARMSPSIDHIVPVSHGGEHSYGNVRASHLTCNIKRGNRTRVA